ncbi:MAG TPA: secondary thiamine-phosphate synthase enzyme YjbQ [Thermodesulfobacteriota bacterium]|nr:secondary thiamine-phosphate synthase enzyme YjbQ [Thermodesulfobacteriota bacterium]
MKAFTSAVRIRTQAKTEEVNITNQVEAVILESGIQEGLALVFTGHTTASVHLNNADRDLEQDFHELLNEIVPNKPTFRHNKGEYGRNADAHLKSLLIGNSVTVPVTKGRLALGQWQVIYFSEFDGPRSRLVSVKVFGTD